MGFQRGCQRARDPAFNYRVRSRARVEARFVFLLNSPSESGAESETARVARSHGRVAEQEAELARIPGRGRTDGRTKHGGASIRR